MQFCTNLRSAKLEWSGTYSEDAHKIELNTPIKTCAREYIHS